MSDTLHILNRAGSHNNLNSLTRKPSSSTLLSLESQSGDPPITSPEEDEEEMKSVEEVIMALKLYRVCSYVHINKTENYLNSLPKRQQKMLSKYRQHIGNVRDCIEKNQDVINKMLREHNEDHHQNLHKLLDRDSHGIKIGYQETEKAQSILKIIARDWSDACAEERKQSYKPIIDAIEDFYKSEDIDPNDIKILVPGAGLGRLTYELACRGYECEGNEFSYFMLIASNFVLNQCSKPNAFTLYPWVHQYVNNLTGNDQLQSVQFPDTCPTLNRPKGKMMIAAGDFLQVYKVPNSYDCVATCFFIDCANNIIDFIETIYKILIPGGIWVNLGPLLYNYCEIQGENSIEPTYDQLVPIIGEIGFEFLRSETGIRTKYAQNVQSMLKSEYESVFWVCRKPLNNCDIRNEFSDEHSDEDSFEDRNDTYRAYKKSQHNGFEQYLN